MAKAATGRQCYRHEEDCGKPQRPEKHPSALAVDSQQLFLPPDLRTVDVPQRGPRNVSCFNFIGFLFVNECDCTDNYELKLLGCLGAGPY
jgi:hypothetical protein